MRTSAYEQLIRENLASLGLIGVDPRHVEAWMRSEWGTLDHLSRAEFRRFIREMESVLVGEHDLSERLAQSEGL